ncbi:hypothetical protein [Nonomuraea dietziae]|uniref:hypothetical protein n=1 Tax=Nonomuraea dietziae TaxID=65515 RepID=UPI0033D9A918
MQHQAVPEAFTTIHAAYAAALERAPLDGDTRRAYDSRVRTFLAWLDASGLDALAAAIADELGVDHDDLACTVLARYVLEIPALARGHQDRRAAVETIFDILTRGWQSAGRPTTPSTRRSTSGS